jgi:hypothetical protein
MERRVPHRNVEQHGQSVHQDLLQQPIPEMPGIASPDPLDRAALNQLPEDRIDPGAEATEKAAALRPGIPRGSTERCQQVDPGVTQFLD